MNNYYFVLLDGSIYNIEHTSRINATNKLLNQIEPLYEDDEVAFGMLNMVEWLEENKIWRYDFLQNKKIQINNFSIKNYLNYEREKISDIEVGETDD